jgi:hypothetical protein
MKIDTIIAAMNELKSRGETDVIVAWWEHEDFFKNCPKEDWADTSAQIQEDVEWDAICYLMQEKCAELMQELENGDE